MGFTVANITNGSGKIGCALIFFSGYYGKFAWENLAVAADSFNFNPGIDDWATSAYMKAAHALVVRGVHIGRNNYVGNMLTNGFVSSIAK